MRYWKVCEQGGEGKMKAQSSIDASSFFSLLIAFPFFCNLLPFFSSASSAFLSTPRTP